VRRLLVLACAIVFVDTAFYAAITPLLPGFEDDFGLSKSAAGVLVAAYPAGTLVGAIPGGYLAAKAGVRATVLLGLGLMVGSSVAFAFADSITVLDGARFVQGIGGAASWAGAMAWVAGAAPRDRRGEMIGTTIGAAVAGALAGPAIGTLAHAVGIAPTFSGIAVVGTLLALWALRTPPAPPEGTSSPRELVAALRDGRVAGGIWLIAVPGLLFGTIGVLAPLRLDELGVGAAAIGAAWLGAALLESGVSPVVGRVSDRRGRLYPSLIGLAAGVVLMLAFPWPDASWQLIALVILSAPAIGMLWAPSMALLSDGAEAVGIAQGFAFALSNLGWSIGQTAGAAASARLADATSDAVPYLLLSGVCCVTIAILARARRAAATSLA
jgi:predicted MFS family arabinose efflux permease